MLDGAHTKNIQYGTFYATHGVLNVGLTSSGFASGDGILSAIVPTIKILEFVAGSIFANAVVDTSQCPSNILSHDELHLQPLHQ